MITAKTRHEKVRIRGHIRRSVFSATLSAVLFVSAFFSVPSNFSAPGGIRPAYAQLCAECCACVEASSWNTRWLVIFPLHIMLRNHISGLFEEQKKFVVDEFYMGHVVPAMQDMTRELESNGQMFTVDLAKMMDADNFVEATQAKAEMRADIHMEFQPSDELCKIGTLTRDLAAAESKARYATLMLAESFTKRQGYEAGSVSADGPDADVKARHQQRQTTFCNPHFNNGRNQDVEGCTETDPKYRGADVNFTQTIWSPLTIPIETLTSGETTIEQEAVEAFINHLVPVLPGQVPDGDSTAGKEREMDQQSLSAKFSVATSVLAHLAGMKASGTGNGAEFLRAVYAAMGIPDGNTEQLGENPSYYAIMEVLTSALPKDPSLYLNLGGSPENATRMMVAMQAIMLMLSRDMYKTDLQISAVLAVLLATELDSLQRRFVENTSGA